MQARDHRHHAPHLRLGGDRIGTGTGRLAADIEDPGAIGFELEGVFDGRRGVGVEAAV